METLSRMVHLQDNIRILDYWLLFSLVGIILDILLLFKSCLDEGYMELVGVRLGVLKNGMFYVVKIHIDIYPVISIYL